MTDFPYIERLDEEGLDVPDDVEMLKAIVDSATATAVLSRYRIARVAGSKYDAELYMVDGAGDTREVPGRDEMDVFLNVSFRLPAGNIPSSVEHVIEQVCLRGAEEREMRDRKIRENRMADLVRQRDAITAELAKLDGSGSDR